MQHANRLIQLIMLCGFSILVTACPQRGKVGAQGPKYQASKAYICLNYFGIYKGLGKASVSYSIEGEDKVFKTDLSMSNGNKQCQTVSLRVPYTLASKYKVEDEMSCPYRDYRDGASSHWNTTGTLQKASGSIPVARMTKSLVTGEYMTCFYTPYDGYYIAPKINGGIQELADLMKKNVDLEEAHLGSAQLSDGIATTINGSIRFQDIKLDDEILFINIDFELKDKQGTKNLTFLIQDFLDSLEEKDDKNSTECVSEDDCIYSNQFKGIKKEDREELDHQQKEEATIKSV